MRLFRCWTTRRELLAEIELRRAHAAELVTRIASALVVLKATGHEAKIKRAIEILEGGENDGDQ